MLRSAFEDSSIGVALIETDSDGRERLVRVNQALVAITGFEAEDLLRDGNQILGLDRWSRQSESVRSTGEGSGKVEFEHTFERPDRTRIWVMVTLSPILEKPGGQTRNRLAQIQDITDRREYQSRLQFLAEHDALTGLANMRRLYEVIEAALAYQRRHGGEAALLSLDLDRFKLVNDSFGHAVGDELLRRFTRILIDLTRETDTVSRLGGDEFSIFFPGTGGEEALAIGREILSYLRSHPFKMDPHGIGPITLSASGGVTELGGRNGVEARNLLVEADSALYAAKRGGRNRVVHFRPDGNPGHSESMRLTWAERTRRALDTEGLFLEAQPIRSLATGEILGHEALLRMNDPEIGVVYPQTFLYTAERFGLSAEIDDWVVGEVISCLARTPGETSTLGLNLTAASLGFSSDLPEQIPSMLRKAGVDPGRLVLELTEGTCVDDIERARLFIEKMNEIGCRVALDDFGAGFGGFYYLKMLPMNILKIDGEFIRSLTGSSEDRLIVKAICDMAHGLDVEVVAEFVTDEVTADICRELGVDAIQGSFVGPAVPLAEATEIS